MGKEITIFEKYGGYDFWHSCIHDLYLDMFDHPEIAYHFIGVDIEELSKLQTQYLIRAIGGPDIYQGRPVPDLHREMGITYFQFDEIAKSFRDVFLKKGVAVQDVSTIMKFVGGHEKVIVTRKTSWIDRLMRPFYRFVRKYFGRFLSKDNSWIRSSKIKGKKKAS